MALFQKSVLRKFLNDLDKTKLQAAWQLFKAHFHNPEVQKHIRDSKEEEYQEGFVRDLFVNVLGYTLKPQPNYNFVLEKKTEADATKSDGAILRNETVAGVIELKDTDTTELDSIEKQVFGYKHKHKNCVYVITSNFEKLRFYINDSVEYEEFALFNLAENEFALLYLCLQQKNIENDIPLKIKQASVAEEEGVTKKLYAGYSTFKQKLFTNIAELNPQYNKLELFRKTQKLLDRFLFILFAEDRLLVPPNSVREILNQWEQLKELDNYVPLYDRFKKYFGYLNKGHVGKQYDIYAYNGGLFADDEILDGIKTDDKLLYEGTKALSNYDFQSEVDVNILGHIFEHSLSEIEEVQAELEGKAVEKTKTKRKKDGVFYTPRYITKYIVENTVGELCRQKKVELNITDDEFAYRKRKDARGNKLKQLDSYRKWLLELTICDPACGSGAFLNQALEFLIAEHRYIDELRAKLLGEKMVMNDMETEILSHNLFGVDINEEAVEIARLSLWLRTAQKGRKLSDLSKSIKCGNSLIDDPAVAGDKAFNWQKEFPEIFKEGGFDVVIGNPPYVRPHNIKDIEKVYLWNFFKAANQKTDLYAFFFEQGISILNERGILSYITPKTWLSIHSFVELRRVILTTTSITQFGILPSKVFEDATVETIITTLTKLKRQDLIFYYDVLNDELVRLESQNSILENQTLNISLVGFKKSSDTKKLGEISDIIVGIATGDDKKYCRFQKLDDLDKPAIRGANISRYNINYTGEFIWYNREQMIIDGNLKPKSSLKQAVGQSSPKKPEDFELPEKIVMQRIAKRIIAALDNNKYYAHTSVVLIKPISTFKISFKYLLAILNSKYLTYWLSSNSSNISINVGTIKNLPIVLIPEEDQLKFENKAVIMLSKSKELQEAKKQLLQLLSSKYDDLNISKKLEEWPSLSFKDFLKELIKQKIKLSLTEQTEWMQHFENEKSKANAIQQVIDSTDKEIDQMVYQLYGLTEEEIKIVEGK